ncbi:DUF413 domain-containing protein [Agarivorans sp. MS3-6]|uniref:DUF413 domain-containing protein n=1 Tax=Agarivorans sp. TSD2052 TaxID=2937286 RepID=UPI00200CAA95|nr:DUF413 domain-containing protein [Agarivorans sp. TSD2052]UPW18473.1 DUF413 domain-containing protein [Agarivorans sp. TSD2052]
MNGSFSATRRFFDDKNFRRGFSRSGAFTIKEAELLERCGSAFKELDEALRQPIDEIESEFVSVCRGDAEPETAEQKLWLKYKKLTGRKAFHGLVSNPPKLAAKVVDSDDDDTSDLDDDAPELDDDD